MPSVPKSRIRKWLPGRRATATSLHSLLLGWHKHAVKTHHLKVLVTAASEKCGGVLCIASVCIILVSYLRLF